MKEDNTGQYLFCYWQHLFLVVACVTVLFPSYEGSGEAAIQYVSLTWPVS